MKKSFVVTLLLFWASFAFGQRDNIDTFSVADTHEFDTVNLITLIPSFNFPGQSKSQGALVGSWQIEVPGGCYTVTQFNPGAQTFWTCSAGWYFGGQASGYTSRFLFMNTPLFSVGTNYTKTTYMMGMTTCTRWDIYGMYDADGTAHPFSGSPGGSVYSPSSCGAQTKTLTTDDNTGYTVSWSSVGGNLNITSAYDTSGNQGLSDPFGNTMTYALNGSSQLVFTDSLGAAMTQTATGQDSADPSNYQYTDANGSTQNIALTIGSAQSFVPRGSSSCVNYPSSPFTVHPVTKITYPDSTSFGITWDTNGTGISGLIGSVTLRTGGSITYTYGSIASGCGPLEFTSLTRATADGNTTYSTSISGTTQTTTVLDPGKNKLVYTFYIGSNTFITLIDRYQNTGTVASPTYTHISETSYCYNNPTTCSTQTPAYPITQLDTYQYTYNGATQVAMSHDIKLYDSTYGMLTSDANTDSINSQTITKTIVYGTLSGGNCVAITNTHVVDHPCTVTTKNGSTWLSESTYTYNANGALTSSSACLTSTCTGSSALTTTYTPTTQGTYSAIRSPNGQTVNYTYGSCNSLMPTDVTTTVNSIAIDHKATWNCDAGLVTDTTDANSNEDDYTYDSMNRLSSYTDRLENVTSYAYGTPTLDHVKITDPLNVVSYVYNDGLGRPTNSQVCQTTGCSNLDTSSKSYAWNGTNFETKTYVPCVKTTLNTACTTVALTSDVNPIAGPTLSTDANSGTLTYAINSKDFSVTAGPAPSQENTKVLQTEVDGFGRITSTCALTSSGYNGRVACGQTMGNNGTLTSNTYSFPSSGVSEVQTVRGSQTHTLKTDAIGRGTSLATPEGGTVTDVYDTISTANNCNAANATSYGDLMQHNNADSSYVCFLYDGLHRVTDVKNSVDSTASPCKRYRYDSTANKWQTAPTGYPTTPYIEGRLFEAVTDNCSGTTLTDEWFAYDKLGHMTDMFESTPTSTVYYHTAATYDADGTVTFLDQPSVWSVSLGTDQEDRYNSMSYGSTTIVSATAGNGFTYDAASRPTNVPVGTNGDQDTFTYDNVGNMTGYTFSVNSKSMAGTLTWNSIGSLNKLVITDGFNAGGAQTCTYGTSTVEGYDDVGRLLDANCGSLIQHDSWTYDQYDNATRTGNPGTSWNPGYSSTTNEMTGSTYDSNGNLLYDGTNTYLWNVYQKMAGTISGNHTVSCSTTGSYCPVYDAFGRMVELDWNGGSTAEEFMYSPVGKVANMSGSGIGTFYMPAPGGGALFVTGGTNYFEHPDWLGSKRLSTSVSGRTYNFDTAYTPYGETYDTFTSTVDYFDFTGLSPDITSGLWDTPNRELATNSSRWLSPDPAHAGWNAYAYPTDPNTRTDPSGLQEEVPRPDTGNLLVTADDWAYSGMYRAGIWNNPGAQPGGLWWLYSHAAPPVPSTYTLSDSDYELGHASRPTDFLHRAGRWINSILGLGGDDTIDDAISNASGLLKVAGVGGEVPEWSTPTFIEIPSAEPSPQLVEAANSFARVRPEFGASVTGDCWGACTAFQSYARRFFGVKTAIVQINGDAASPILMSQPFAKLMLWSGNPQFNYTGLTTHFVNVSEEAWVVDMSATQFDPWISFPYIFSLINK